MATNVELKMLNNFLKPSLQSIENNLKMDINQINSKISNFNITSANDFNKNAMNDSKLQESSFIKSSSNRNNDPHMDTKISEINKLGERLYEKLMEKVIKFFLNFQEKKLNELKNETTSYLKKKINTSTGTNFMNSEC